MKWAFLISGIIEILGALACYFAPQLIYHDGPPYLIKLYGLSALALGTISVLLYKHYKEQKLVRLIFITMMFFHGAVAMMTYGHNTTALPYPTGIILTHLGLFVLFVLFYMMDLKPDNPSTT